MEEISKHFLSPKAKKIINMPPCPTATVVRCEKDEGPCGMYCPKTGVLLASIFGSATGGAISGINTGRQASFSGQEDPGREGMRCYETDQGTRCVSSR